MSARYLLQGRRLVFTAKAPRAYSTSAQNRKSPYSQFYSETVPAMIPIFLLGSAIYLGLQLTQQKLSHEKYMEEATTRVQQLEAEVDALQDKRASQNSSASSVPALATPTEVKASRWRWW